MYHPNHGCRACRYLEPGIRRPQPDSQSTHSSTELNYEEAELYLHPETALPSIAFFRTNRELPENKAENWQLSRVKPLPIFGFQGRIPAPEIHLECQIWQLLII